VEECCLLLFDVNNFSGLGQSPLTGLHIISIFAELDVFLGWIPIDGQLLFVGGLDVLGDERREGQEVVLLVEDWLTKPKKGIVEDGLSDFFMFGGVEDH
jgi:hypothetical protein